MESQTETAGKQVLYFMPARKAVVKTSVLVCVQILLTTQITQSVLYYVAQYLVIYFFFNIMNQLIIMYHDVIIQRGQIILMVYQKK